MSLGHSSIFTVAIALLSALAGATPALAGTPTECTQRGPGGYCVEWGAGDHAGSPGGSGGGNGSAPVVCYWVNMPNTDDPTVFADWGLPYPEPGAVIQWQEWRCSDDSLQFKIQWVYSVPPVDTARNIRVRIEGQLGQPVIEASPPLGTPSIIGVPVFVAVSNWTGVVTDSGCGGGLCVTVTATPKLSFSPGESGSNSVACNGSGTKFNRSLSLPSQISQAGACVYTYKLRTSAAGRPAEWPGAVTVVWSISWTATSDDSGTLPSITRTSALPRGVQEVQTVVVGGNTP